MCPEEFWKSRVAGLSDAQSQPCSCGNADSLSSLSSCGNADSLSPLCAHLGVLHPERQDYRQEGSGCPGRGVLPHYRDAQQQRKGEGGPPSSERIVNEELHISEPQAHGKDQKNDAEISVIFLVSRHLKGLWHEMVNIGPQKNCWPEKKYIITNALKIINYIFLMYICKFMYWLLYKHLFSKINHDINKQLATLDKLKVMAWGW